MFAISGFTQRCLLLTGLKIKCLCEALFILNVRICFNNWSNLKCAELLIPRGRSEINQELPRIIKMSLQKLPIEPTMLYMCHLEHGRGHKSPVKLYQQSLNNTFWWKVSSLYYPLHTFELPSHVKVWLEINMYQMPLVNIFNRLSIVQFKIMTQF